MHLACFGPIWDACGGPERQIGYSWSHARKVCERCAKGKSRARKVCERSCERSFFFRARSLRARKEALSHTFRTPFSSKLGKKFQLAWHASKTYNESTKDPGMFTDARNMFNLVGNAKSLALRSLIGSPRRGYAHFEPESEIYSQKQVKFAEIRIKLILNSSSWTHNALVCLIFVFWEPPPWVEAHSG